MSRGATSGAEFSMASSVTKCVRVARSLRCNVFLSSSSCFISVDSQGGSGGGMEGGVIEKKSR